MSDTQQSFPTTNSTIEEWNSYYKDDVLAPLDALENSHTGTGISFYAVMNLMYFMSQYNENYLLYHQAEQEDALTQIGGVRNNIEKDFDANATAQNTDAAHDARAWYYGGTLSDPHHTVISNTVDPSKPVSEQNVSMEGLLNYYGPSGLGLFDQKYIDSIEKEFVDPSSPGGTIFQGETTDADLAKQWNTMWSYTYTDDTGKEQSTEGGVQPVTDAFTAVSTSVDSKSSSTQAAIKQYASDDQQYQSMEQDVASAMIAPEKQSNTAMQNS